MSLLEDCTLAGFGITGFNMEITVFESVLMNTPYLNRVTINASKQLIANTINATIEPHVIG